MVNSFHATFDRRRDNRAGPPDLPSPNALGVNMFDNTANYSNISVSNYSGGGFGIGCGSCAFANFDINTYQMADDFSIIKGKHQIGFGFDGRKDQFNSFNNQQSNGMFTFNGQTSGDGLADLLIGRFSKLTDGYVISDYLRQTVMAAYVQDAIHVTSHFSINIGVRWEPSVPAYDKYGRGGQFNWHLFRRAGTARLMPILQPAWSSPRIRRKILTAKRSRHRIGPRSRPGSAWFGIRKATANRPFARRSITITIPPCCSIPSAGPPMRRMSLRSCLAAASSPTRSRLT